MSVIVTVRVAGDPAKFEEYAKANPDALQGVLEIAKRHGVIAHRFYAGDGEYMAMDEWPDGDSFHAFFTEAGPQISPMMEGAGVTSEPVPTVWQKMETGDDFGWES